MVPPVAPREREGTRARNAVPSGDQLTENFKNLMASKSCTPPPTRLVV